MDTLNYCAISGTRRSFLTINGVKMKQIRFQAAHFIFEQIQWSGKLEVVDFDPNSVDVSDISDDHFY